MRVRRGVEAGHKMNESTKRFIYLLKRDIAHWEETAAFLEDPHVEAVENIDGPIDKTAMAARYRALAAEYRDLLAKLSK
jgi:hypothetical protein